MRNLITCVLNNVDLSLLDDRIFLEDVTEEIDIDHEAANRSDYGMLPMNVPRHKSIVITIKLMIKERRREQRDEVLLKLFGWAKQGWLTTNVRPNKRLYVFCTKKPKIEAFKTTARFEVQFTAYGEAYWQDVVPLSFDSTTNASSASLVIRPLCTHECFFEATITNKSNSTLTTVTIANGDKELNLTGLSVSSNQTIEIFYDELHLLHIESGGISVLSKRTASSVDDLKLEPNGDNTITMTFNVACAYSVKIRRLWE